MKNIKSLFFSLLALIALAGVGWGTYTLNGPLVAAEAASDHTGHDHGKPSRKKDAHGHADTKKATGTEEHGDHDDHDGHGRHDEDEDLEGLFADEKGASAARPHADHDHDSHAEARTGNSAKKSGHSGHDHAGHDHRHADGEICPDHNVPEVEDALCNPEGVAMLRPGEGMKVRLASPQVAGRVGITATLPLPAEEAERAWPGQVVFNRDRVARLTALASGTVVQVKAGLGEGVQKGAVLAEISAPEAAGLRSEMTAAESRRVLAETVYRREKDLFEKGISSRQEYQQAEAELRQAESDVVRVRQQGRDMGLGGAAARP